MLETYRARKRAEAQAAEVAALRRETDSIVGSVASREEWEATDNHARDECLLIGGSLYRTARVIVRGERMVPGINIERTMIVDELARAAQGEE